LSRPSASAGTLRYGRGRRAPWGTGRRVLAALGLCALGGALPAAPARSIVESRATLCATAGQLDAATPGAGSGVSASGAPPAAAEEPRGAAPHIAAGESVLVSGDRSGVPHVEPILAAHPEDPGLLFGAAVTFADGGTAARRPRAVEETTVAGFRSTDGGRSWARVPFPRCLVDPWVAWGRGEDLYLSCLMRGGAVAVYRSADGGRTWRRPALVPTAGGGSADHPIVVFDRSAGPRGGTVYVVFAQQRPPAGRRQGLFGAAVAAGGDGGRRFSAPSFVRQDDLNQQPLGAAVLSDGTLVLLFVDYASYHLPRAPRRAWAARSVDGGRTFAVSPLPLALPASRLPLPLAVDRSAAHRDRLYAVWPAAAGEPDRCPRLAASDDRGEHWRGLGVAGGGDGAGDGDGVTAAGSHGTGGRLAVADGGGACKTPALAVNGAGVVGVAWYDTRRDPRGEGFDVDFSASLDGGLGFLPEVRVTAEPSFPRSGKEKPVASRWPFGGDYSGLAAGADGRFHLLWADRRAGTYQLWTVSVEVSGGGGRAGRAGTVARAGCRQARTVQ
jgi:hypothetical protein